VGLARGLPLYSRMTPPRPRLHIVDSLLDLDERSSEPDAIRARRAHLAKYAKASVAGALVICVVACARLCASALAGAPEAESVASTSAAAAVTSDDPAFAAPKPTPGGEVLVASNERITALDRSAKGRKRAVR